MRAGLGKSGSPCKQAVSCWVLMPLSRKPTPNRGWSRQTKDASTKGRMPQRHGSFQPEVA